MVTRNRQPRRQPSRDGSAEAWADALSAGLGVLERVGVAEFSVKAVAADPDCSLALKSLYEYAGGGADALLAAVIEHGTNRILRSLHRIHAGLDLAVSAPKIARALIQPRHARGHLMALELASYEDRRQAVAEITRIVAGTGHPQLMAGTAMGIAMRYADPEWDQKPEQVAKLLGLSLRMVPFTDHPNAQGKPRA